MTRKAWIFFVIGIVFLVVGVVILVKVLVLDQKPLAAIQVVSSPESEVFINGQLKGKTPFKDSSLAAGEYNVKLTAPQGSWESKIKLNGQTVTFIKRNLNQTSNLQSGQVLSLEAMVDANLTEITIASDPKGALVKIDGKAVGATPMTANVDPSDHEIILSFPEYVDEIIKGRAIKGYRLNIYSQLAKGSQPETAPVLTLTPTPDSKSKVSQTEKPYVLIKNTPTGWLRVRMGPNSNATESGRVNPNETFPYVEKQGNWVKIKYLKDFGWVSADYVQVVN